MTVLFKKSGANEPHSDSCAHISHMIAKKMGRAVLSLMSEVLVINALTCRVRRME